MAYEWIYYDELYLGIASCAGSYFLHKEGKCTYDMGYEYGLGFLSGGHEAWRGC